MAPLLKTHHSKLKTEQNPSRRALWAFTLAIFTLPTMAQQPTANDLLHDATPSSPLSETAFARPANAKPPSQAFEGFLSLRPEPNSGSAKLISTLYEALRTDTSWKTLPTFRFELLQSGDRIFPAHQGLLLTGSPAWNLIVGQGYTWDQSEDEGYTRAALPFALIERGQNCVHNGSLTFLFRNTPKPTVSQVRYQITQETCYYMKADFWGQVPAAYLNTPIPNAAPLRDRFADEQAHRLPRKPLSDIAKDFPNAHFDTAALLRGREHPEDVTAYGLAIHGIHYASGCPTRFGEYTFCDEMRMPSYSTAKSAFAAASLMYLGQRFGTQVYDAPLADYLQTPTPESWKHVTIANAIDMATGHFLSPGFERDEDGPEEKFLVDESLKDKLADALAFPYKIPTGKVFNYQSHNTFLATIAMNNFVRAKVSPTTDLFRLMSNDVYRPLHLSEGMLSTLRTGNSEAGAPEGYFGLFFIQDDVVKLARFFSNSRGQIDGKQLLEPKRLEESLTATNGLPTGNPRQLLGTSRYTHAFWNSRYTTLEFPQLTCDLWAPYMSGYGGITIMMLPNDVIFYVFSDAEEFVFNDAVLETNKLSPLCPAQPK